MVSILLATCYGVYVMSPIAQPRKRVDNPPQQIKKSSRKWLYLVLIIIVIAIVAVVVSVSLLSNQGTDNEEEGILHLKNLVLEASKDLN